MSDFRKLFLAFAAVALILGSVASAQVTPPVTCNTTGQPLDVRTEGLTEQVGDIILQCTGGQIPTPGTTLPQVNVTVTLTTNITSRLLADPVTEALLFVDDPQPANQSPCAPAQGSTLCTPLVAGTPSGAVPHPANDSSGTLRNIFQAERLNDTTIVFRAVPIFAPGSQSIVVYRIKNIRGAIAGASATNGQIFAFVSIQNPPANLQVNQASVNVGFVLQGLTFSTRSATGGGFSGTSARATFLFQCESLNNDLATNPAARYGGSGSTLGRSFEARFREGYQASFKVRDVNRPLVEPSAGDNNTQQNFPQNNNGTSAPGRFTVESGFFNTGFTSINGLNRAGRADHGTRLRLAFSNVPANIRVYVSAGPLISSSTGNSCPSIDSNQRCGSGETSARATAYGVATDNAGANVAAGTVLANPLSDAEVGLGNDGLSSSGIFYPAGARQGLVEVLISSGAGAFTWEVFNEDPSSIDTLSFAVAFSYRAANNPGLGTIRVNGSFAPLSTVRTASATAPIPRFSDTSTAGDTASLNVCQTNLLFPFVTNQAGFDTGIAIANTTADPFGTAPQSGNCTLYYYGTTAGGGAAPPSQTTTSVIASGVTAVLSLSSGGTNGIQSTPGFQGYIIVTCNFRLAHGFAFISDLGSQKLAQGYVALVLDTGTNDSTNRTGLLGEGLMQ